MGNITIKDIAKIANVSYATVSRAITGSKGISEENRQRILKICDEVGYTTNIVARSMIIKTTKVLGLIVPDISNPFQSEVVLNIELFAQKQGYSIMLCNSFHDPIQEEYVFSLLIGRQVDGIIIIPSSSGTYKNIEKYLNKVPTVFIGENLGDNDGNFVSTDNKKGTYIGTKYLYDLGHRKIAYIGQRIGSNTHALRAFGYKKAAEELGIKEIYFPNHYGSSSIETGYKLAKEFLKTDVKVTAIFAATDTNALGILQALDEMGIRVPEDISVLGFDNIVYSSLPKIMLTTIEQPKKHMASVAIDLLLNEINQKDFGYSHRILEPILIERNSCTRIK